MSNPPSHTGGVKPMSITGRMARERERLLGMSDTERAWRAQWLKDQILAPDEPVVPKNFYQARYNAFRRFYRAPLDLVEAALRKPLGEIPAGVIRHIIGKSSLGMVVIWGFWYNFKYNGSDWTKKSGWKVTSTRAALYPNDPDFPNYETRKTNEYASFGFTKSPI